MLKNVLIGAVVCLLLTQTVFAGDYAYVSRDWKNPSQDMQVSLSVSVPIQTHDSQGHPVTSYQTEWVHVRLHVTGDASLRLGETEYFRVTAYAVGSGFPTINVHVDPDLVYHSYRGAWGTVNGHGGYISLNLYHDGRIKNTPPATFDNVSVEYTVPEAPFILTFDDFAAQDNAEADNTYSFEIVRDVFLFPNKLVAKGEVSGTRVIITKGCPFTSEGKEYFKKGKKYLLDLRLKREGAQYYTDSWSYRAKYKFTWKDGGEVVLERVDDNSARTRTRLEKFREIHRAKDE